MCLGDFLPDPMVSEPLILRTILDRLIYNDEYKKIDKSLNDLNVGAWKGRNVRDNIFVVNAVLTLLQRKKKIQ